MDLFTIYSKMPLFAQNVLLSLQGSRLKKQRYNKTYLEILDFLNSTSNWNTDQIKSYKEEKTFKIIEHAFKTCPYYKDKYSELGLSPNDFKSLEDLQKFPILTKDDVRSNWKGMVSTVVNKKELVPSKTSGSTGQPLDFYWTRYSIPYYWALYTRYINRFTDQSNLNLNMSVKPIVPVGTIKPPFWRYIKPLNQYRINMQQLSNDKIPYIVDFLNETPIVYYVGYCSIFSNLSEKIKEAGLKISSPPTDIFVGSEKLYDSQKAIIEEVFKGSRIHEMYSLSEQTVFASHCEENEYHEDFEIGHMELINSYPMTNGIVGDVLATNFVNYGMPFIRYFTGDTAFFSEKKCTCGKSSQVIEDILGRTEDYLYTPEGAKIHTYSYVVKGLDSVKECQVYQKTIDEIIVRVVKRNNYNSNSEKQIVNNVRTYLSKSIDIKFEYLNEIPHRKSGKLQAVISEINQ